MLIERQDMDRENPVFPDSELERRFREMRKRVKTSRCEVTLD